jgi:hypothetical protein
VISNATRCYDFHGNELLLVPRPLPPIQVEVASCAGATATAWWRRALPSMLEPGHYHLPWGSEGSSDAAASNWSVWIEIWPFKLKNSHFYHYDSKKSDFFLKIVNFIHHPINTAQWFEFISHPFHHIFTLFFTLLHSTSWRTTIGVMSCKHGLIFWTPRCNTPCL